MPQSAHPAAFRPARSHWPVSLILANLAVWLLIGGAWSALGPADAMPAGSPDRLAWTGD